MDLSVKETKGCAHVAYDGEAGEHYRFPDGETWSVTRHWWNNITGFKAALITSGEKTVLAFAGTDSLVDVAVDIVQVLGGVPHQYTQALILAASTRRRYPSMYLAGHSLGGGLAAYCSVNLHIPTGTINPAPLVGAANLRALFGSNDQIVNYIARGGEFVSSSPGRNPGRDVYVESKGGMLGFLTDHMLANTATSVPLPVKL